ncbi:PadR family transcriptional regulator [Paenibacillus turpanensis]|uniref:PadR family transcriptional regulator n=1 Tax=Paenibacillus turpanensis TaxID=2689078 RepID=UPI00140C1764|nr:PadR family transcriptional regulator [Paenibacillus turpanensis]
MKVNKELLKGSTATMLLALLKEKDRYGYEIIKEIEKKSEGVFVMKEGTLYPILHLLENDGLLASFWSEQEGRKRKYYKITDEGRAQLAEKQREWMHFRTAVDKVLGEGAL